MKQCFNSYPQCLHVVCVHQCDERFYIQQLYHHALLYNAHQYDVQSTVTRNALCVCVHQRDECCSQLTISFHKVDPTLMKIIDHLLYRTSVYGRVLDMKALEGLVQPGTVPPLP